MDNTKGVNTIARQCIFNQRIILIVDDELSVDLIG